MPPVSPKKKAQDAPPAELLATVALRHEVEELRLRALDAESRLQEAREEYSKLFAEHDQWKRRAGEQRQEWERARQALEDEVDLLRRELEATREEAQHTTQVLKERLRSAEADCHGLRVMERENVVLRQRLHETLAELEKQSMQFAESTHGMQKSGLQLRMQLEQTFRKTLQELDEQRRALVFQSLSDESKEAMRANERLRKELALQSTGIQHMLERYQEVEQHMQQLKREKELLQQRCKLQHEQLVRLKRTAAQQRSDGTEPPPQAAGVRMTSRSRPATAASPPPTGSRPPTAPAGVLAASAQLSDTGFTDGPTSPGEGDAEKWRRLYEATHNQLMKWRQRALDLSRAMLNPRPPLLHASAHPPAGGGSRPAQAERPGTGATSGAPLPPLQLPAPVDGAEDNDVLPPLDGQEQGLEGTRRDRELAAMHDVLAVWQAQLSGGAVNALEAAITPRRQPAVSPEALQPCDAATPPQQRQQSRRQRKPRALHLHGLSWKQLPVGVGAAVARIAPPADPAPALTVMAARATSAPSTRLRRGAAASASAPALPPAPTAGAGAPESVALLLPPPRQSDDMRVLLTGRSSGSEALAGEADALCGETGRVRGGHGERRGIGAQLVSAREGSDEAAACGAAVQDRRSSGEDWRAPTLRRTPSLIRRSEFFNPHVI